MAGNENFRSSITLTTTRSTGASVARTAGGAAVDGHAAFIATNPVFGKNHAAQTPALHRCHERHHVPHHSIYRVHGGGLRSHRGRVQHRGPAPWTRDNHAIPCVPKVGEKMPIAKAKPQPGGHLVRQSLHDKTPLFMGSSGVLFATS